MDPLDRDTQAELTRREAAVLRLAATGRTSTEIAAELGEPVDAVRAHLKAAMLKLGARSKLGAIIAAVRAGQVVLSE